MAPFATTTDLQGRMRRTLTTAELATANLLLADASGDIEARFRDRGWSIPDRIAAGLLTANDLLVVTVRMVKRAMALDDDLDGVKSIQETTGPFSGSTTFANPMGDLYLTKADLRRLGLLAQRAGHVDMFETPAP